VSPETRYKIEELEQLTGLSRRLVYDYISRDLVPPAMGSGKGAYYLQEHYDRLRLISLLRKAGFRLERNEEALTSWEADEIARIVDLAEGRDVESLEALDEWLSLPRRGGFDRSEDFDRGGDLDRNVDLESFEAMVDLSSSVAYQDDRSSLEPDEDYSEARRDDCLSPEPPEDHSVARLLESAGEPSDARQATPAREYSAARRVTPSPRRTPTSRPRPQTWERVEVSPDIEINYRQRRDSDLQRRVAELLEFAEALFGEPAPPDDDPNDGE